jgi:non-specific serine/threonine protein kinase
MILLYNITEFGKNIYLPSAWIASKDKLGQLTYLHQKASPQSIADNDILVTTEDKKCLDLIQILSPSALEKKYNANKKNTQSLLQLLENKDVKTSVRSFIDRHLDQFYNTVADFNLPLAYDAEAKTTVQLSAIQFAERQLIPMISFRKKSDGIFYHLHFREGRKEWAISDKRVLPVANNPAWLIVDQELVRVPFINALMVIPFRDKYEMVIPKATIRDYFQQFILKVIGKVEHLETEGFEIKTYPGVHRCIIEIGQDFIQNKWGIAVRFDYGKAQFSWKDPQCRSNSIEFLANEEIIVHKVMRNEAVEGLFIKKLFALGLQHLEGHYFYLNDSSDFYQCLQWLSQNRQILENQEFTIGKIQIEHRTISLKEGTMELNVQRQNDWFDLYGAIQVGDFSIPFGKILPYIKNSDAYYPLPDGTYYVLPPEWFEKYGSIAQFGKVQTGSVRIAKSQNALLTAAALLDDDEDDVDYLNMPYEPSPFLKADLRPYQTDGVRWMIHHYNKGLGACLADDMGLGKTLQTIAVLCHAKTLKPRAQALVAPQLDMFSAPPDDEVFLNPLQAIIVLPASLVFNWKAELFKFSPQLTVYEHVGAKRCQDIRLLKRFDVVLTTYQTALKDIELFEKITWEYAVLDESHYIKNKDSQVYKAISRLQTKHKISLSGTPIENSLSDLWAQMQFINPGLLGGYAFFEKEFLKPIEKLGDEPKKEQLRALVSPYLLRRTKGEVAKDLPPLSTQIVWVEMSAEQAKRYDKEKSAARNLLSTYDGKDFAVRQQVFHALTRLRQIVNHPQLIDSEYKGGSGKMDEILEYWNTIRRSDHKMLMFSSFTQHLNIYKTYFEANNVVFSHLTGSHTLDQRKATIKKFQQQPDNQSFLISLKAGGTGLNLTEADYVLLLDPWWNPQAELQAVARAHRIGQTKSVIALKFITKNSIEEKILALQARKSQLAADLLENVESMQLTKSDLSFLLE